MTGRYDTLAEADSAARKTVGAWKWWGPWAAAEVLLAGGTAGEAERAAAAARPNEIDRILEKLGRYWRAHPELRLGQIVVNALPAMEVVFYVRDDVVEASLEKERVLKR